MLITVRGQRVKAYLHFSENHCLMPSELGIFSVLLSSLTPMSDQDILFSLHCQYSIKEKSHENTEKYHLGNY